MCLDLIRNYIQHGLYNEARRLIDIESDVTYLMNDEDDEERYVEMDGKKIEKMPLLVILALIKDEENAVSLSRLLLERGYHLDTSDCNGMSAMNYALALNKKRLVELYLNLFNVELNSHRDRYGNCFLHYAFAVDNIDFIKKFAEIYSKFYEWDTNLFVGTKNYDGLSIQDLYTFFKLKNSKNYTTRTNITNLPDYFKLDSNPIKICKFINRIYYSNSTKNTELLFVTNTARILSSRSQMSSHSGSKLSHVTNRIKENKKQNKDREFKLNLLYQIRSVIKKKPLDTDKFGDFNKILEKNLFNYRNTRFSPINNESHSQPRMMSSKISNAFRSFNIDSILESPILSSNLSMNYTQTSDKCWKTDLKKLYIDYETINTASYFKPVPPPVQWEGSHTGSYSPDFTNNGSEMFSSRTNSVFSHHGLNEHSTLAEFQDSNKKLKKSIGKNGLSMVAALSAINTAKKEKWKNTKTKSLYVQDEMSSNFELNIASSESSSKSKKKLNRGNDKKETIFSPSESDRTNTGSTKIVKPSLPTKWSKKLSKRDSDETSLNSRDS